MGSITIAAVIAAMVYLLAKYPLREAYFLALYPADWQDSDDTVPNLANICRQ